MDCCSSTRSQVTKSRVHTTDIPTKLFSQLRVKNTVHVPVVWLEHILLARRKKLKETDQTFIMVGVHTQVRVYGHFQTCA